MALRTISAFTGGYGLELGLELAFPGAFEPILYVEVDVQTVNLLASLMEEGFIPEAPVWSNVCTVTDAGVCAYVREATGGQGVGVITAGYPCPDFSTAGKRKGLAGEKGKLWFSLARAIRAYKPGLVFLENVGGHLRRGFYRVRQDLQRMGYRVKAGLFTAEEVGASQKRERLFVLAYREGFGRKIPVPKRRQDEDCAEPSGGGDELARGERAKREERQRKSRAKSAGSESRSERCGEQLAYGECSGRTKRKSGRQRIQCECASAKRESGTLARSKCERLRKQPGRRRGASRKGEAKPGGDGPALASLPLFPPRPDSLADWLDVLENEIGLAPAVGKAAEPAFCQLAHGLSRVDVLRIFGNGVVAIQAAYAFRTLAAAAGIEEMVM